MATYELQGPNGEKLELQGPDGAPPPMAQVQKYVQVRVSTANNIARQQSDIAADKSTVNSSALGSFPADSTMGQIAPAAGNVANSILNGIQSGARAAGDAYAETAGDNMPAARTSWKNGPMGGVTVAPRSAPTPGAVFAGNAVADVGTMAAAIPQMGTQVTQMVHGQLTGNDKESTDAFGDFINGATGGRNGPVGHALQAMNYTYQGDKAGGAELGRQALHEMGQGVFDHPLIALALLHGGAEAIGGKLGAFETVSSDLRTGAAKARALGDDVTADAAEAKADEIDNAKGLLQKGVANVKGKAYADAMNAPRPVYDAVTGVANAIRGQGKDAATATEATPDWYRAMHANRGGPPFVPTVNPDEAAASAGVPQAEAQIGAQAPDAAAAMNGTAPSYNPASQVTLVRQYVGRNPSATAGDIARDFNVGRVEAHQLLAAAKDSANVPGTDIPTPSLSGQSSAKVTTPAGSVKVRGLSLPKVPEPTIGGGEPSPPAPVDGDSEGLAAGATSGVSEQVPTTTSFKPPADAPEGLTVALSSGLQKTNGFGRIVLTDGSEVPTNVISRHIDHDGLIMDGEGNFVHMDAVAAIKDRDGKVIWKKPEPAAPPNPAVGSALASTDINGGVGSQAVNPIAGMPTVHDDMDDPFGDDHSVMLRPAPNAPALVAANAKAEMPAEAADTTKPVTSTADTAPSGLQTPGAGKSLKIRVTLPTSSVPDLPEGAFEPKVSRAGTTTNNGRSQTVIRVGKADDGPHANYTGVNPTHLVIGVRDGGAPRVADPVWSVAEVDPKARGHVQSNAGVGKVLDRGLTRDKAIAKAKEYSAEKYGPKKTSPLSQHLDQAANAADARLKTRRRGRVSSGVDPEDVRDLAIWGGAKLAKGLIEGAHDFGSTLAHHFGAWVKPHLDLVWGLAKKAAQAFVHDESGFFDRHAMGKQIGKIFKRDTADLGEAEPPAPIDDVRNGMSWLERKKFATHNGPLRSTAFFSPTVAQAGVEAASTPEHLAAYVEYSKRREGYDNLTDDQKHLIDMYYTDQRARNYEANGESYNTKAIPKLTPEQMHQAQSDPAIQHTIQEFRGGRGSFIETARLATSPGMKTRAVQDFLSMLATKGEGGEDLTQPEGPAPPKGTAPRPGPSKFAQESNGMGQEYNHNFNDRADMSTQEVFKKAALQKYLTELLNTKDSNGNPLARLDLKTVTKADGTHVVGVGDDIYKKRFDGKSTIDWEGKTYAARELNTKIMLRNSKGKIVQARIMVPEPVAADFERVIKPKTDLDQALGPGMHSELTRGGSNVVALSLAIPTEAFNHANRLLDVAGNVLLAKGLNPGTALAPAPMMLKRVLDLDADSEGFQNDVIHLNKIGAGSTRAFQHAIDESFLNKGLLKPLGKMSEFNHKMLFNAPGGKGWAGFLKDGGFDVRLRVAMLRVLKEMEPDATESRQREFINQFGQYATLRDGGVNYAQMLNPYAATKLPLMMTELRQLAGDVGVKKLTPQARALMVSRMIVGTTVSAIAVHFVLNYLLSGHSPMQNDAGHKFDIEISDGGLIPGLPKANSVVRTGSLGVLGFPASDGKAYIPLRQLNPAQSRVLNETGLRNIAEDALSGDLTPGGAAKSVTLGVGNAGLGIVSGHPGVGAVSTALTGKAPYFTRKGELYRSAPVANDPDWQVPVNIGEAAAGTNSLVKGAYDKGMEWAGITKPRK